MAKQKDSPKLFHWSIVDAVSGAGHAKLAEQEGINREYITLDDLTERQMAKNVPKLFLQIHKPPVFIDEVQYASELFTYIKIHIDQRHC